MIFGYYLFVYVEMFVWDCGWVCDVCKCMNECLFGLVVFVGIFFLIDWKMIVVVFGFDWLIVNLLDVVFDCDFVIEVLVVVFFVVMYLL